jgi:hypothetical protein
MANRRYRINLANNPSVEIELEADKFQYAGENSIEFILGNQNVLCVNFRSRIERTEEITATQNVSRPDLYLVRRIDLDL